jgi:hypothetical protein
VTRWDLASLLSDALERGLPRGCRATLEVPARAAPADPKDALQITAHVKFQGADGAWRSVRAGASLARLARAPEAVTAELVSHATKLVERARAGRAA